MQIVRVRRMVDLIRKGYAEPITLKTLATTLHAKPDYLGRLFQSVVGTTVHQYVTRVRLEQGAFLIRIGLKIEAVALAVGYRSKKNFYRQFIRHYSVTPETYRQRRGVPRRPKPVAPRHHASGNGMRSYTATFEGTACLIDVEIRPNVRGRASYFATPFVLNAAGLQPFATVSNYIEIQAESESDALERAAVFLEHRFGIRTVKPKLRHTQKDTQPILAPRP